MTAQKKILDLTGSQYLVQKVKSAINDVDSSLSTHIADTDIHVTTADKNKWNNQTYVFRYSSTALVASSTNSNSLLDNTDNLKVGDKVIDSDGVLFSVTAIDTANSTFTIGTALIDLAQDSDVVHKSGNETVGGQKTLVNLLPLKGEYLGTESSNNGRTLLYFIANRDTQDQSGIFLTKFRQNKAQGAMSGNDIAYLSFDCLENSVRTNNGLRINFLNFVNDIPQRFILWSGIAERLLGTAAAPWSDVSTNKINGVEPSSLGMPDLNNGIDISSYITDLAGATNAYSPPANGYIVLRSLTANVLGIVENTTGMGSFSRGSNQVLAVYLPVVKNSSISIYAICSSLTHAKFIPCQGNV